MESGCVVIDIRKISNHPANKPGNDAMDRYKINYKGVSYQLMDFGGHLTLVKLNPDENSSKKKTKASGSAAGKTLRLR